MSSPIHTRSTLVLTALLLACGDDGGATAEGTLTAPTLSDPSGPSSLPPTSGESMDGSDSTVSGATGSASEATTGTTAGSAEVTSDVTSDATSDTLTSAPMTSDPSTSSEPGTGSTGEATTDDSTTAPVDVCKVNDDMDAIGECDDVAPPNSFTPDVQWSFGDGMQSWVTPLAGNFTDDNGDGEIDLCDIPDVLLVAGVGVSYSTLCPIYILDGATGSEHFNIPTSESISCTATPAFGDIDNDGLPEIVAVWNHGGVFRLKAFEHDGTLKWANTTEGGQADQFYRESGAVALHDLDADGDVEIVFNHEVYDHMGKMLWFKPNPMAGELEATTAADLDGDGKLEVITGHSAYRWDGAQYFENYPTITAQSIPQVGNLDGDPEPEIFITSGQGVWMVEHTGAIKWGPATPTGVAASAYLVWQRPGTIHDFDGDLSSEWASSSRDFYAVMQGPNAADVVWQAQIQDFSGAAGGTAFDFLGDGVAEAMYADEQNFRIYDGKTGAVQLTVPRGSPTISEYPTVADVDNDGSAEIMVVSYSGKPALQVLRDAEDRWIQARRIWNQHAYYVTNVREDSTIPQFPVNNWESLNTFRTNAQIEGGALCDPRPQ
ncbi:MAG: VCBS repeat-containing protein [Myxococcales bacterium]|nr:VCBS repeat-containing protein [Myxococcales bacterium]